MSEITDIVTVLAIDDESDNTELMRRALANRRDMRVLVAFSAREALAVIMSEEVHVILVDERMPQMTGSQMLERVHQLGKRASCIMVTAYPDEPSVVDVLRRGLIQCVVAKPWRVDDLLVAVDMAVQVQRQRVARA